MSCLTLQISWTILNITQDFKIKSPINVKLFLQSSSLRLSCSCFCAAVCQELLVNAVSSMSESESPALCSEACLSN